MAPFLRRIEVGPCLSRLGRAWGLSATIIGSALAWKGHQALETVDPHTGDPLWLSETGDGETDSYDEFRRNMKKVGLEDVVRPIRATSREAAERRQGPFARMIFIDGLHTYEAVSEDIDVWLPHLQPNAVMVFDDYDNPNCPGVQQAVNEAASAGKIRLLAVTRGLAIATARIRRNPDE